MHEHNFIHRDVKPQNILSNKKGHVVLADFGIACTVDHTQTTAAGTIEYCAPEQMDNVSQIKPHPSLDVYSLGMTLYEMVSGVNPYRQIAYQEGDAAAIGHKYISEYPPATIYAPAIPYGFSLTLQKMIANNPEKRYQTMKEVIRDLEMYARPIESTMTETCSETEVLWEEARKLMKQKKWEEALKKYDRIIALLPSAAQAYYDRGQIFLHLNIAEEALKDFTLALRYRPSFYSGYCQRSYAYLGLGNFASALEDMEKAIELSPKRPEAFFIFCKASLHKKRMQSLAQQGNREAYRQELELMKKNLAIYKTLKS
jgi:serine/threonine protein kinase